MEPEDQEFQGSLFYLWPFLREREAQRLHYCKSKLLVIAQVPSDILAPIQVGGWVIDLE